VRTSLPFETGKRRSTILSVQRDFNSGRNGHSARRIESTLSSRAASERFKTTIESGHGRLILEAIGLFEFVRLQPQLGEIVHHQVDLVTLAALKPQLRERILRERILREAVVVA